MYNNKSVRRKESKMIIDSKVEFPTPWRWKFAFLPVSFGNYKDLWLEWYEVRRTDYGTYEIRHSKLGVSKPKHQFDSER
jgi:hypothetical protein